MKKITKITASAFLMSAIISSGAFANGTQKSTSTKKNNKPSVYKTDNTKNNFASKNNNSLKQTPLIGQVKSVDVENNKIKITDADGKDIDYVVTGFTRIIIMNDSSEKTEATAKTESTTNSTDETKSSQKIKRVSRTANKESSKLSDIQAGSWVILTTFKGETKTQQAASIFVKPAK